MAQAQTRDPYACSVREEWNLPAGDDVLVFHSIYTSAADEAAKEASDRQGRSWGLLDSGLDLEGW